MALVGSRSYGLDPTEATPALARPSSCFLLLVNLHAMPGSQIFPRPFDPLQETWVVFQLIIEPVVFGLEADQHSGRLPVAGDDDLALSSLAQIAREVALELGQRNLPHWGLAYRASHGSASDLGTIARISTVEPETS